MPNIAKVLIGVLIAIFLSIVLFIIHVANQPDPPPRDETNTLHLKDLEIKASGPLAKDLGDYSLA